MSLKHTSRQFEREAQRAVGAVRREASDRLARLGAFAYQRLVERTEDTGSVDTGAYRAEHVVEIGGTPVFEHPRRPGPDAEFPSRKRLGLGPLIPAASPSSVARALRTALRQGPAGFTFVNRRRYANALENGTAAIEPRQIYAGARDATDQFAASLALEPPKERALRR